MPLIDTIAERYNRRTRIEVPEWGNGDDEPLVIYASPYTLYDERRLGRFLADDNADGFAEIVVRKAQDEDGKRLFDDADRPRLVRVGDAHVVKRIAMAIVASLPTVEDAEGN